MSHVVVDADRTSRGARIIARSPSPAAGEGAGTITRVSLDGQRPEHRARRSATAVLARLGVSPERRGDVELAVTELVANAGLHAPGPRELRVRISPEAVTLAVADGGGDYDLIARILADPSAEVPWFEEHGRGLRIVAALFPGACGVTPAAAVRGGGGSGGLAKEVWISLPLGGHGDGPDPPGPPG
jgi:anti-sigma regulatory factor (Ser/Thr protein kinase)